MNNAHDLAGREEAPVLNPWGLAAGRVISLVSQKGGVGKTTSTVNLAAAFALSGHRALIIGTDPQCGVSRSLGFSPEQLHGGLREVLLGGMALADVAHPTTLDDLSMVVPDSWSLDEERQYKGLMESQADEFVGAVDDARADWDTILIDCPPGFGSETRAALAVSDAYLVPVQAEELCRDTLGRLLDFIADDSAARPGGGPRLEGLFMTMTDHRTLMSRNVAARLDDDFGPDLLDTSLPRTTRLSEMAVQGRPTVIYDR
jgi:chromosome partitioning protein